MKNVKTAIIISKVMQVFGLSLIFVTICLELIANFYFIDYMIDYHRQNGGYGITREFLDLSIDMFHFSMALSFVLGYMLYEYGKIYFELKNRETSVLSLHSET